MKFMGKFLKVNNFFSLHFLCNSEDEKQKKSKEMKIKSENWENAKNLMINCIQRLLIVPFSQRDL